MRLPRRSLRPYSPERALRRILDRHERLLSDPSIALDVWESHQPVLVELLRLVPNARVLELGLGYGSTPVVIGLSGTSVSIETVPAWYERFERFSTEDHRILLWSDFSEFDLRCPLLDEQWDIALLDNSPGRSRPSTALKLADRARFIVCHDTEELFKPSAADYRWDFSSFKYVWTYTRFDNYTTVVSNAEHIPLDHL